MAYALVLRTSGRNTMWVQFPPRGPKFVSSTQHKRRNEMSRETQFIGLNNYAEDYISNDKVKKVGQYPMTKGMFEEDIYGGIYEEWVNSHTKMIYEEVVQDSPWSSGPMIFTHFKVTMVKVDRETNKEIQRTEEGFYFSWMKDPSIHDEEYDAITGRYYV